MLQVGGRRRTAGDGLYLVEIANLDADQAPERDLGCKQPSQAQVNRLDIAPPVVRELVSNAGICHAELSEVGRTSRHLAEKWEA